MRELESYKNIKTTADGPVMIHYFDNIELNAEIINKALQDLKTDLFELEFSDDSCSQYYEEDVLTLVNICSNQILRSLKNIENIIRYANEDLHIQEVSE